MFNINRILSNWIPGLQGPAGGDLSGVESESPMEQPIHYRPPIPSKPYFIRFDLPQRLYVKRGAQNEGHRLELLKDIEASCSQFVEAIWMTERELNMIVDEKSQFRMDPTRFMDKSKESGVDIFWCDPVIKIIFKSEKFPSVQSIIHSIMLENKTPADVNPNHFSIKGLKCLKGTRFFKARLTIKPSMRAAIDEGFIYIFGQRLRFYDCIFRTDKRCVTCHSLEHHYVDCSIVEPICFWCGNRRHDGDCTEPKICIFCSTVNGENTDHLADNPIACKMNQKAIRTAISFFGYKYVNFYLNPKNFLPQESAYRPSHPITPTPNWPVYMNQNSMNYQTITDNPEVSSAFKRKRS